MSSSSRIVENKGDVSIGGDTNDASPCSVSIALSDGNNDGNGLTSDQPTTSCHRTSSFIATMPMSMPILMSSLSAATKHDFLLVLKEMNIFCQAVISSTSIDMHTHDENIDTERKSGHIDKSTISKSTTIPVITPPSTPLTPILKPITLEDLFSCTTFQVMVVCGRHQQSIIPAVTKTNTAPSPTVISTTNYFNTTARFFEACQQLVVLVARVVSEIMQKHQQHHQQLLTSTRGLRHDMDNDDDVSVCTPTSSTSAPITTPISDGVKDGISSVSSSISIQLMIDNLCVLLAGMYLIIDCCSSP